MLLPLGMDNAVVEFTGSNPDGAEALFPINLQ